MKYTKTAEKKLIDGILPFLRDVETRVNTIKEDLKGWELLARGITETKTGEPIVRTQVYKTDTPVMAFVNHRSKLEQIIKDAKTEAQVENDLALYVAKNGKSLEAIQGKE